MMMRPAVTDSRAGLAPNASTFRAIGTNAGLTDWPGEEIQFFLEGTIQINGDPLLDTDGPAREILVQALLQRYRAKGEEFLKDLAGSFRLAVWDSVKQKLVIAVDPFATRPLYYTRCKGVLSFAPRISCLSALPEVSKEIDPNVLCFYLNHSFVPAPFTVYREIRRLEPGQYLCWQDGALTVRQYWDLRYDEDFSLTVDAASELIRSTVEGSVRSYLEAQTCGLQHVGAFLSGGTDSSTLVGLMTKVAGDRTKTFSVGFAEERYNEIQYARIAAARYNAEAHEYFVSADEALNALPLLATQFDEPFGNSSAIPTYFCLRMAKEAGVTLMFAGDGGDELFGGNERYVAEKHFLPFDILPGPLRALTTRTAALLPTVYPLGKIRRYIERASEANPKRFFHYQIFLSEHADEFFTQDFMSKLERDFILRIPRDHYQKVSRAAPLNRLLYMDLKMCIADNDLFKVNQMATAAGVNVCYPYLDRNLAELTGKIPAAFKLKGLQKRYIFKKAFDKLLPDEILQKKKHGFGLPIARWLRQHPGFRELTRSLLLDRSSWLRDIFRSDSLEDLLRKHDEEQSDFYGTFIWNAMMLELWQRNHPTHETQSHRPLPIAVDKGGSE
jgi:asparagine synthase (glutamine-hydrolysing)